MKVQVAMMVSCIYAADEIGLDTHRPLQEKANPLKG